MGYKIRGTGLRKMVLLEKLVNTGKRGILRWFFNYHFQSAGYFILFIIDDVPAGYGGIPHTVSPGKPLGLQ